MNYTAALTLDEALAALAGGARPVAGGSDIVVGARQGKAPLPDSIVGIHRVAGLATITVGDSGLVLGALVNHATIEAHDAIVKGWTALADGSALVGSPSTRNVGTIGGNVMNSSPAMDTGAPLIVLEAVCELSSKAGSRSVPIDELWTGPGRSVARPDELLVSITVPSLPAGSGSAYIRLEYRRAMEIAVVGAAAMVTLNGDGDVADCRIALTAVAPTIVRARTAEAALAGKSISEETLAAVAAAASAEATPISDLRGSDRYRRHTVGVMARRAVEGAVRRARGEHLSVPLNRADGIGAPLAGGSA